MPRDPVGPAADSNDDSYDASQSLPRTHDNIQPRLDLISRTGRPLRLKSRRSRIAPIPLRWAKGGDLSQFSRTTGRCWTMASLLDARQDADLRTDSGALDRTPPLIYGSMLPCPFCAGSGAHAGRHEPTGREADLCTGLCTRRGGTG